LGYTLIVTAYSEGTAREIKEKITVYLMERGLELSDDKTLITNINEGFDFLAGISVSTKASF
jgi:RNA-directed DNA polymerase